MKLKYVQGKVMKVYVFVSKDMYEMKMESVKKVSVHSLIMMSSVI